MSDITKKLILAEGLLHIQLCRTGEGTFTIDDTTVNVPMHDMVQLLDALMYASARIDGNYAPDIPDDVKVGDTFFSTLGMMDVTPPTYPIHRLRLFENGLAEMDPKEGFTLTIRGWGMLFTSTMDTMSKVCEALDREDTDTAAALLEPGRNRLLQLFDILGTNNVYTVLLYLLDGIDEMSSGDDGE